MDGYARHRLLLGRVSYANLAVYYVRVGLVEVRSGL